MDEEEDLDVVVLGRLLADDYATAVYDYLLSKKRDLSIYPSESLNKMVSIPAAVERYSQIGNNRLVEVFNEALEGHRKNFRRYVIDPKFTEKLDLES